jgi:hypothetical protein
MSSPPDQPPTEPDQRPEDATIRSSREKRKGAIVATVAILVSSALVAVSGAGVVGLMSGTVVALLCVILGSILTIFERTRLFAAGFLIASAVLMFVTAGVCTFALRLGAGMA